jgi:hypothetical protein
MLPNHKRPPLAAWPAAWIRANGMEPAWPSRTVGWPRSVVTLEGPRIYGRSRGMTTSLTTDTT